MEIWIIWLVAACFLLCVEVLTQSMWSLCLTVGFLAAMVVSLCGPGIEWQVVALVLGTVLGYLILLPLFRRRHNAYVQRSDTNARTGMDALLGRTGTVTNEIKPGAQGRVRIDGDNWLAIAPGCDTVIDRGTQVKVTGYESIVIQVTTEL